MHFEPFSLHSLCLKQFQNHWCYFKFLFIETESANFSGLTFCYKVRASDDVLGCLASPNLVFGCFPCLCLGRWDWRSLCSQSPSMLGNWQPSHACTSSEWWGRARSSERELPGAGRRGTLAHLLGSYVVARRKVWTVASWRNWLSAREPFAGRGPAPGSSQLPCRALAPTVSCWGSSLCLLIECRVPFRLEHLTSKLSQVYFGPIEVVGTLPGKNRSFLIWCVTDESDERPMYSSLCTVIASLGPGAGYLIILLFIITLEMFTSVVPTRQLRDSGRGVVK